MNGFQGILHFLVSQAVNQGVQQRGDDCVEHSKYFVNHILDRRLIATLGSKMQNENCPMVDSDSSQV